MNYPTFLIVALGVTIMVAVAIAGPLSALCLVGFWVAHGFFVQWLYNEKNLKDMTDNELQDVLNYWTKGNVNSHTGGRSALDRLRGNIDKAKLQVALARVIEIYDEMINRNQSYKIDNRSLCEARGLLINERGSLTSATLTR